MGDEPSIYSSKGIAFSPTFECPGMCDHCNIRFDELDASERLPVETGLRILREGKAAGLNACQVVGGEPTIYEDFFVEIYSEARRLSMKRHRPPTNCWLGGDAKRLSAFFDRLKSIGFSSGFRISLDTFHRRIPLEFVARFILTASEYFSLKPFVIGCCDINEDASKALLIRLAEALTQLGLKASYNGGGTFQTEKESFTVGFWAPTRPTWKQLPDEMFRFSEVDISGSIQKFHKEAPISSYPCLGPAGVGYLWIDPSGDVRPCCGNAINFIDELILGNANNNSIEEIIQNARSSEIISKLAAGGPVELAKFLGMTNLLKNKYTHRCDLCHTIFDKYSSI